MKATQDRDAIYVSARQETVLDMARRHVREGAERIARQEEILVELDSGNYPEAAALGRAVLETMRSSLDLSDTICGH